MKHTRTTASQHSPAVARRYPVGAEFNAEGTNFRVWAPRHTQVEVVLRDGDSFALTAEENGYFSGTASVAAGEQYRFRLGSTSTTSTADLFPDPASRFQPEGPFGWSEVVDPTFQWTDTAWRGYRLAGQIIYEMHVGTFTQEGTWQAAEAQLRELADLGITVIEVMPVADFAGSFGWGYDGVNLFAPTRLYGRPEDFRHFVDTAHSLRMGVILDVVYNHVGPAGNFLPQFSDSYFTHLHETDWGEAINYYGENSAPVREFFLSNARYWTDEFHLDGLRLDATQNIYDESPVHILEEIGIAVRTGAGGRDTIVVAENEPQNCRLIHPASKGGYELDGLWNDDFHHSASVALTGHREAYYSDYSGRAQEFVAAVKHGFLFQGQRYAWQKARRGTSTRGIDSSAFVVFLENHDQISNSVRGERLNRLANPGRLRAMTALLLLAPWTPMLFQGQEFAASTPFLFFADHEAELAGLVAQGRKEFLSQFRSFREAPVPIPLARPDDFSTFTKCKLNFAERDQHHEAYALHRELIRLRRTDSVFQRMSTLNVEAATLSDRIFVIRYEDDEGSARLLIINLDIDIHLPSIAEPLIAPPTECVWQTLFSSEDSRFGGFGAHPLESADGWTIPAESATVLTSMRAE